MNIKAFLNTISTTSRTLPIVIIYLTEGCNLRCATCSYRDALPGELTLDEITKLADDLAKLGLKHIVYSGGEPLLRRDLVQICEVFKNLGVKQTILTNGLLLEKRIDDIANYFHEIIVSIDGATAETHNLIRGVNSFDQILKGINRAIEKINFKNISIRTVIQKRNFRQYTDMINLAKSLHVSRISFLSADVYSDSFGRDTRGSVGLNEDILLNQIEIEELAEIMKNSILKYWKEYNSKFISEPPQKLYRIIQYYKACINSDEYPRNICNAPMVSTVITSTGNIHPCYFLPSFGNIRKNSINELINNEQITQARKDVKEYNLQRCHECVCTLYVSHKNALLNKF